MQFCYILSCNHRRYRTWQLLKLKSAQLQNGRKEKTDEVRFRVPKGERIVIQAHAKAQGETTTAFIKRAIREAMERDNSAK